MTHLLATANELVFPFAQYWGFYLGFGGVVIALLGIDLFVFHRKSHAVGMREAMGWTTLWVTLSCTFGFLIWIYLNQRFADMSPDELRETYGSATIAKDITLEFFTGYVVEKSLSIDNMFVFVVIFGFFSIPAALQHRVLFYGILGALVFRAIFVAIGAALIQYTWVVWIFGLFLIGTGIKILFAPEREKDPESNPVLKLLRRWVPLTPRFHGERFFVKEEAREPGAPAGAKKALRWVGTPLFVALAMIEISDVIFAVDSVPAVFAITREPFVVFTSNIFAIMGLRSLYFLLAGAADRFHLLKFGLGVVLVFVGVKMVLPSSVYPESWGGHFPTGWSLGLIVGVIGASMVASLVVKPKAHSPGA